MKTSSTSFCPIGYVNLVQSNLIKLITKKRKNLYLTHKQILNLTTSLNLYIISTSKGIVTHKQAIKNKQGGELLCKII